MCMISIKESFDKFLAKHSGQEFIWAYKVLLKVGDNLHSPHQKTHQWKPGWKISDSRARSGRQAADKTINRGIFVYLENPHNWWVSADQRVVRVKCYLSDLLGVTSIQHVGVFRRAYLPQSQYDIALGRKKPLPRRKKVVTKAP